MARHRRGKGGGRFGIWSILNKVLPALAFISQATSKEKASYQALPTFDKLKAMINNLTGNAFGINFFGGTTPQFTEKFNPAGIANRYTGIGIAGIGLKFLNKSLPKGMKVPYLGRIASLATKFLGPGIIGGVIDTPDAPAAHNYTPPANTPQFNTNISAYDSTRLST